jgi:hypothetical protein
MKITLKAAGEILGTADWDPLPVLGATIQIRSANGQTNQSRRVDKIEDDPSGGKIVYLGGAQPTFTYSPV